MDDFWTDLDQVLDEFEKNEGTSPGAIRSPPHVRVGPPKDPPSYSEVKTDISASMPVNLNSKQVSNSFYQEMPSACSDMTQVNRIDLKSVPGSGIFDLSEPGSDLNTNVQRLERMGNDEFVSADLHDSDMDLYQNQNMMYPQQSAELCSTDKTDEGHFIPDDHDTSNSAFAFETPLYDPQNKPPYTTEEYHKTDTGSEILQVASELHAHIGDREDRPSFMSSSPPALSVYDHPAMVPSTESGQTENQSDSGVSSEQGESNIVNSYMNTSPVHRIQQSTEHPGVPHSNTLQDIAQHSYAVPSGQETNMKHPVPQSDIDTRLSLRENDVQSCQKSGTSESGNPSSPLESGDFLMRDTAELNDNASAEMDENASHTSITESSIASVTHEQTSNAQGSHDTLHESKGSADSPAKMSIDSVTIADVEQLDNCNVRSRDALVNSEQLSSSDVTPTNMDTYQAISSLNESPSVQEPNDFKTSMSEEGGDEIEIVKELVRADENDLNVNTISSGALQESSSVSNMSDSPNLTCDNSASNVLTQFHTDVLTMTEADMAAVDSELAALEQEIAELKQGEKDVQPAMSEAMALDTQPAQPPNNPQTTQASDAQLMSSDSYSGSSSLNTEPDTRTLLAISNEAQSQQTSAISTMLLNTDSTTEQGNAINNLSLTSTPNTLSPEQPSDGMGKRRGSGESVERFLAPAILSPGIATPMDDPGFTKVPGFQNALDSMSEEEEQNASKANALTDASKSCEVRPKEGTPEGKRRSRPNSLLGLSKPDLPLARLVKDPSTTQETNIIPLYLQNKPENTHDDSESMISNTAMKTTNNVDSKSLQTGMNQGQQTDSILRQKPLIASEQTSESAIPEGTFPPGALTLAFPPNKSTTNTATEPPSTATTPQAHTRPASWPVQEASEPASSSQKQRRPNSLNLPSRGGSISPSEPVAPSPMMGTEASTIGTEEPQVPAAVSPVTPPVAVPVATPADVESAAEAVEGATGYSQEMPTQEASSSADSLITVPTITSPGRTPGTVLPPQSSSNPLFAITDLGKVPPKWVPDAEAPNCMECELKFTFTKRRHHCRACGKVFCSNCCYLKSKLQYMENKEARVCSKCYQDLIRAVVFERMSAEEGATVGVSNMAAAAAAGASAEGGGALGPDPNDPSEYCSTVPPMQQANVNTPPPSVMVPVGVLRKEGSLKRENSKKVIFSDGIRPGGDLTEIDGSAEAQAQQPYHRSGRRQRRVDRSSSSGDSRNSSSSRPTSAQSVTTSLVPHTGLPPRFLGYGENGEFLMEPCRNIPEVMALINGGDNILQFVLNKNLLVLVKLVNMDCCVNKTVWCFTSQGMCTVAQDELVVLLEVFPDEECLPIDLFQHFQSVYEQAAKGHPVTNMEHTIVAPSQGFLDSRDHGGFLYVRPTFQCLNKLIVPQEAPYVFAVLLQKWETPWAKVFPLRLLLRLGAEFRYYPCPLVSVRFRKPVFGEIGHTIMNVLVDFRNYKYVIPRVRGFTITMRDKKTYIQLPRNRYDDVMRALASSTDQVLALAANFSKEADSYLVCIQNDEGNYETQAINIHNKPRQVTGASFVVFNANVKRSDGIEAKSSIVEDGLMVQILPDTMMQLREALKQMREFNIEYGGAQPGEPEEAVIVQWIDADKDFNVGVMSPIDKFPMDGVSDVHIHNAVDYLGQANKAIRWTQVFFLQSNEETARVEAVDLSRLAEALSQALCVALASKLDQLAQAGYTRIGLRATISNDNVGYEVGSKGEKLPDLYMNALDNELIPVIHNAAAQNREGPVVLELIFHVINTEVLYKNA